MKIPLFIDWYDEMNGSDYNAEDEAYLYGLYDGLYSDAINTADSYKLYPSYQMGFADGKSK